MWYDDGFMAVLIFWGVSLAIIGTAIFFDRIIVALIRHLHIRVYPEAINIALSIYSRPDIWTEKNGHLHHVHLGTIDARKVGVVDVAMRAGTWAPNFIERRIIFEATSWHIKRTKQIKAESLKRDVMQKLTQPLISGS
jgi:hypothetical protein